MRQANEAPIFPLLCKLVMAFLIEIRLVKISLTSTFSGNPVNLFDSLPYSSITAMVLAQPA